jgi:hypothetical protein
LHVFQGGTDFELVVGVVGKGETYHQAALVLHGDLPVVLLRETARLLESI